MSLQYPSRELAHLCKLTTICQANPNILPCLPLPWTMPCPSTKTESIFLIFRLPSYLHSTKLRPHNEKSRSMSSAVMVQFKMSSIIMTSTCSKDANLDENINIRLLNVKIDILSMHWSKTLHFLYVILSIFCQLRFRRQHYDVADRRQVWEAILQQRNLDYVLRMSWLDCSGHWNI